MGQLNITIASYYSEHDQSQKFKWEVYDGPDGIDHYFGVEDSLGQCFESIVTKRIVNSLTYNSGDEDLKDIMRSYLAYTATN